MDPLVIVAACIAASLTVVLFLIGFNVWNPEESVTIVVIQTLGLLASKVIHSIKTKKQEAKENKVSKVNILIVLLSLLSMGACTRSVAGDKLTMKIKTGPPCVVKTWMDGELIQESTAVEKCKVTTNE